MVQWLELLNFQSQGHGVGCLVRELTSRQPHGPARGSKCTKSILCQNNHNFLNPQTKKHSIFHSASLMTGKGHGWENLQDGNQRGQGSAGSRYKTLSNMPLQGELLKIVQSHFGLGWDNKVTTTSQSGKKKKKKEIHKNPQKPPQTAIIQQKLARARNPGSSARAYCRRGRRRGLGAWGWNFREKMFIHFHNQ